MDRNCVGVVDWKGPSAIEVQCRTVFLQERQLPTSHVDACYDGPVAVDEFTGRIVCGEPNKIAHRYLAGLSLIHEHVWLKRRSPLDLCTFGIDDKDTAVLG